MDFDVLCESHFDLGKVNPKWLELRKTGVTASDTAKLLGGGSVMKLWAQKTGRVKPDDLSSNERVRWGQILESAILHGYAEPEYAGRPTTPSGELCRSKEYPWMLATLDAWTEHPSWGSVPLDAKNTDKFEGSKWEGGPPEKYLWQIRHQAITVGTKGAGIVGLIGGNQLVWADEELRKAHRDTILDVAERFWWCVENDVPPDQVDGLPETRKALNAIFVPTGETFCALPESFEVLDEQYAELTDTIKKLDAMKKPFVSQRDTIENQIRLAMKNSSIATLPNGVQYIQKQIVRKPYTVNPKPYNKFKRVVPK